MKTLTFLLMALISFSSFADVKVIKGKVNGTAVETKKNVFNILNPSMTINGKNYALVGSQYEIKHNTGVYACNQLNMKFVDIDWERAESNLDLVTIESTGAIEFNNSAYRITVLTCEIEK